MEQFKLKVERCFHFDFQPTGVLICLLLCAAIFIERALAIIQQCHDHTDKHSLEHSYCWTRLWYTKVNMVINELYKPRVIHMEYIEGKREVFLIEND